MFWFKYIPDYKGEKVILYTGRVAKEKDLDVFIEVAERFENNKDVKFVIVGDGPYKKEIQHRAKNVVFTGYLEGEELSKAYASSFLFLFPSTTETFGNVVLEALASGLPVLVSDKGAAKENVISGVNGFVVKNNDVNEYTNLINRFLDNRELYESIQNSAVKLIRSLDYEKLLKNMINEFSLGAIKKRRWL
ncbi:MAG: glycosyltransferase [Persephonella sp.]|nr:glycosyltransferase [Persephonella sp.]